MYKLLGAHRYISYPIILATRECHQSWAFLLFPRNRGSLADPRNPPSPSPASVTTQVPAWVQPYKNKSKQKLKCNKENLTDFENPSCPSRASVTRWLPAWVLYLLQSTLQTQASKSWTALKNLTDFEICMFNACISQSLTTAIQHKSYHSLQVSG